MAEFEQGYCTGCGYKVRRWGHRPYCWRKITMMLDVDATSSHARQSLIATHQLIRLLCEYSLDRSFQFSSVC